MAVLRTAALLGSLAASAYAHGRVTNITANDENYTGFITDYLYTDSPPDIVAWSAQNGDNGFVDGTSYSTGDIICHKEAKAGKITAKVAAGSKVEVQWGPDAWPESHHGPIIDYLAKCDGDDCTTVDKETLKFFKIDEAGLIDGSSAPGQWASDELISNGGKWSVTIPESLAPGQYVLRHEIIALHSAGTANGAQNYPQCFNLEVTGSGSANPDGVLGTELYKTSDAGITLNIYTALDSYEIPGPALWDGASSGSSSGSSSSGSSAPFPAGNSTAAGPTSAGASSSAAATTSAQLSSSSAQASSAANTQIAAASTSAAATSTYAASSAAATSAAAAVTKVADSVPSSALTSTISTELPSPTGSEIDADMPSKPLPEGFTLADLLAWVDYLLTKAFKEDGVHARDLERR